MKKNDEEFATAANAAIGASRKLEPIGNLAQVTPTLYDLADIIRKLNVSPKTIYNWRVKGSINLIPIGGKFYLTQKMFKNLFEEKGGKL